MQHRSSVTTYRNKTLPKKQKKRNHRCGQKLPNVNRKGLQTKVSQKSNPRCRLKLFSHFQNGEPWNRGIMELCPMVCSGTAGRQAALTGWVGVAAANARAHARASDKKLTHSFLSVGIKIARVWHHTEILGVGR